VGFLRRYWFAIVASAAILYWFFTGTDPIMLLRHYANRGRKLAVHHLDASGNVIEQVENLLGAAVGVLGRTIERDAYLLASVSASEHAKAGPKEKALIQRVMLNDAAAHGWSLEYTITVGKGLGSQAGRRCSTVNGPWEQDLLLAEANLRGELPDDSMGAAKFVHITGYRSMAAFLASYPNVQAWVDAGTVPVDVGGVSTLRIFVPQERLT
jgi:hypothetical protein